MNYTGLKFDGGIFYKGCECKVIKQLIDWDDVYKAHQDFGYSFKKIQDNYLVRCCGKNSIWSEEEIKEMIQPNLKESIIRILKETQEDKIKRFLFQRFDKVFDELNLKVDYEGNNYVYGKWFDKDGKDIFHRNDWGVIWIINCEPYKELYIYSKSVGLNGEEFEKILVEYFNDKYLDQFLQKLFKTVSNENNCLEDEF